jgi:hypothetical protein
MDTQIKKEIDDGIISSPEEQITGDSYEWTSKKFY